MMLKRYQEILTTVQTPGCLGQSEKVLGAITKLERKVCFYTVKTKLPVFLLVLIFESTLFEYKQ